MNRSLMLLPLLLLCAWLGPSSAMAETGPITLRECIEKALPYADAIKLAEESLYAAEQDRLRARSVLIPTVELTGRIDGSNTEIQGAYAPPNRIEETRYGAFAGLGLSYSFYLNGRELIVYKASGELVEKAGMDVTAARHDYMLQVAVTFVGCIRSEKGVAIAEANLTRLISNRDAVIRRIEAGLLTRTEQFRSDAEVAGGRAELKEALNQRTVSRRALQRLVPLTDGFQLMPPETIPAPTNLSLEECVSLATENRPELKALVIASRVADKEVAVAKSTYWPKLTIEGSAGRTESRVDGSYDNLEADFDLDTTRYMASLTLSLPLMDGGLRRADIRKSLSDKRSVDHRLNERTKEIRLAVERAWYDHNTESLRVQALEESLTFARQFLDSVTRRFDEGLAESLDLIDANTRFVEAENQLADARFALQLAAIRLRYTSGVPMLPAPAPQSAPNG
ncbi:TolC family protein [Desulfoluna spongiiphila]|uniref:Outer membrane protein n=1 Tax=Desulfoluna spongiiphila TaxID=419481 RepID=A0A1G5DDG7_9BACT|nr:TolC family protein [Desulfoluna spongiiphila]SCY12561.1 outer membrane protein [Desulfoluna spongiiphila]